MTKAGRKEGVLRAIGMIVGAIVIACATFLVIAWIAFTFFDPFGTEVMDRDLSAQEAAELTLLDPAFKLPTEARDVHVRVRHWQDTDMYVRFVAPRQVAMEFASRYIESAAETATCGQITHSDGRSEQLPCRLNQLETGCGSLVQDGVGDWWLNECPVDAVYGDAMSVEAPPAREIVIVPHADSATVYISTFSF